MTTKPLLRAQHLFPLLCLGLTIAAFYPGHLSFDSAYQFWQARTGETSNLSPIAMTGFWSAMHRVWPGSGGVFFVHVLCFWTGVWVIACALYSRPASRIAATLLVAGVSPALLVLSHLWTDAALIACLTLACALMLRAALRRDRLPLYAAIPFLLYGGLVRHNALSALIPLLAWWWVVFAQAAASPRPWPAPKLLAGVLVAVAAIFGIGRTLDAQWVAHRVSTFAVVQLWDLAAISLADNVMLVPEFVGPPGLTLDQLRQKYSPYTNVPLYAPPYAMRDGVSSPFSADETRRLWAAWRDAVGEHPAAYAKHRLAVATALFGRYRNDRPRDLAFVATIVPYKDNPSIAPNDSRLHASAVAWYRMTVGWWIGAPLVYIVLALACAAFAWRRRSEQRRQFALATAVSGLMYVAPLPLVAPSAELRYSGWLFAAATIALIALLPAARPARRTTAARGQANAAATSASTS